MDQAPPLSAEPLASTVLPTYRVTRALAVAVPVKVAVVFLVTPSLLELPLSEAAASRGCDTVTAVTSTVAFAVKFRVGSVGIPPNSTT